MAAKWLPRYVARSFAADFLAKRLGDPDRRVAWWAAVHLSRLGAADARLARNSGGGAQRQMDSVWPAGVSARPDGSRRSRAALRQLGGEARSAVPALVEIGAPEWSAYDYDGLWAASAIWRIAGNRGCTRWLAGPFAGAATMADRIEEIGRTQQRLLCFVDWSLLARVSR